MALLASACSSSPPAPASPGVSGLEAVSVVDLVDQITGDQSSLVQAFEATQEALARGGIATVDVDRVYVAAYLPVSPVPAIPQEVLGLTLEARERETVYRMTLEELAQTLNDLGWPFRPEPSHGEQMIEFLAAWISAAQANPTDPHNFTPLFLAEMSRRQAQAVDLAAGEADPSQVQFSLLELELFTAAFDRLLIFPQSSFAPDPSGAHLARLADVRLQEDPCSKYKHLFYAPMSDLVLPLPLGQQLGDFGISFGVGELMGEAMEKLGIGSDDFGTAMGVTSAVTRVWKLFAIYSTLTVTVDVEGENPVHKPLEGELLEVTFDAHVGVSEADWQEYQEKYGEFGSAADRVVRDCMAVLGLPTFANVGEIAREVESYAVEWKIVQGKPDHAIDAKPGHQDQSCSYHLGWLRCDLQAFSDHSAVAPFHVEIKTETESDHPGVELKAPVKVCAYVDASQAPSLSTFINGAQGGAGLADSITELVSNMILKLGKPKGCSLPVLNVTYHLPLPALDIRWNMSLYSSEIVSTDGLDSVTTTLVQAGEVKIRLEVTNDGSIIGKGTLTTHIDGQVVSSGPGIANLVEYGKVCGDTAILKGSSTNTIQVVGRVDEERRVLLLAFTETPVSSESTWTCGELILPSNPYPTVWLPGLRDIEFDFPAKIGDSREDRVQLYPGADILMTITIARP